MKKVTASVTATALAVLALLFCAVAFSDVPHNRMIRAPQPTLTILTLGACAVIAAVLWVWISRTRGSFYCALAASGLLLLFSLACLCV